MEQDDASGRAPSSGRKRRSGGKRKRSASRVSEEEIKPAAAAEEAPNAKEQAAEDEEKPPAQWPCPTCTFLNEASRCYCEMCETPNPTPSAPKRGFGGASGATAPDWSCAACTVTNPGAMRVCAVCGTLNPRPPALTIGRLGAMSDEEFSDDSEDDDSDDSDEEGAWICRSCDMLATGNTCPECFSLRPKTADTTNSSKEDKEKQVKKKKRQKREKQKQERAKMAYGVSIFALKQLMQEPASSRLVDTLQTLTHTLAMMDASADSEWGDGPSFLIRSFGGMPSSSDTSKDPELLNVLANIFGEHERKYPVEVRLLAVQSINYLMKMDRHMFARSKMVEIVALYISALLSWKSKKSASSQESADVKSAQMVVEECLNGLSSLCYTEAFALREVLGRGNFIKYLDFMSILTDGNEGDNGFHPSIVMTALGILQKCCMKLRWSAKPSKAQRSVGNSNSQKPAALRISPKKSIQDSKFTLELATKLVSFLRRVLQHKHVPLHVKAAKCLLLIFHRTPYDHPEVIAKLVTSELLREFVAIVVNANGEESEESRLATISLLLHLFDNRPQLVSLFVKEGIYTELFSDMLLLLQSSSTALRTSTLKLTALLTRVVCRKHSSTPVCSVKANKRATISVESGQPSPRERKRSRLNSLPDPDVLSTLLLDFIRADSIPAVNAILKDGADLNFPKLLDVHGNEIDKPLHAAAEYASLGMVRFLVKRGADVHQVGPNGTALHVAAKAGRCDVAAFLLQCGARVQAKDRDRKSVMDVVKSLESSSEGATPSPMKKLLVLHQGTSGIIDYDSDLSESDSMCGNGSRTWFFPSDHEEDDYGDEDDDDMDDDELEDDEGHDYYLDYDDDDDDDDDFDRIGQSDEDMGDEDGVRDQETTYDDVSSSAIPSSRNFPLESIASESEMKTEEAHLGTPNSEHGGSPISSQLLRGGNDHFPGDDVVLDKSADLCVTSDEIYSFSLAIAKCLLTVLHDMDVQNVERSVLSMLACVLEMAPSQLIRSLSEADMVLILDTVHFLLQGEKHRQVDATVRQLKAADAANGSSLEGKTPTALAANNSNLPSFILALRILQAMVRKSSGDSSIFHQIDRRGIGEQIEQLNEASACWVSTTHTQGILSRKSCDTIFGRGLDLLRTLRAEMFESGTLHLHKLKNLARRLMEFTDLCSSSEEELLLVDLVELFDQPNSITTYEFKQSDLLPAVLQYLSPQGELNEGRAKGLMRAFERSPSGLKHLLLRLQSIITQEETFPLVSFNSSKGRELYPLTRQLKIAFMRPSDRSTSDRRDPTGRPKGKSIHSSPLTHFQSFERTVSRCMPVVDTDLSILYMNLVGHSIQKVVEGKWKKFTVVGYDNTRSYHLFKPLGGTNDDLSEMVLHDSQCKLLDNVDVYEKISLDLQLFGSPDSPGSGGSSEGKKKRKGSKRKRKTSFQKQQQQNNDDTCQVEVKNGALLGLPTLPGAWYAAVLVSDSGNILRRSGKEQTCERMIAAKRKHSVKLVNGNRVVCNVPADCIRPRSFHPQMGSVVEVDGSLAEIIRLYTNDRPPNGAASAADTLMDVKTSAEIEKTRVKKEHVLFPPATPTYGAGSDHIEAMSIRRLFPARDSSLLAGSVGDRVWVFPPLGSAVQDLCVAGTIKSFPSGMESIRESTTVIVEISFGLEQPPLAVKVNQDRVLNFAVDGGGRPGHGASRLLAALQMASGRSGSSRLLGGVRDGSDSSTSAIHRAFERVAGSLQFGGGHRSSSTAMDQIRQMISRNSMFSSTAPSDLDTPEQAQPVSSNARSPSSTTPPNEPIGSEVQTEEETSTSTSSSPRSKTIGQHPTSTRQKRSGKISPELRSYMKTEGTKQKWTCLQLPKVNLVVGFRKCDTSSAVASDRIVVSSEFGLEHVNKAKVTKDTSSMSVFVRVNPSTQRVEAKPGARQVLGDIFNSFSGVSHKKKKRKLSLSDARRIPTEAVTWDVEKFVAFMSAVRVSGKYGAISGRSSTDAKYCILFSKFASPESNRRLLGLDEFIALMVHECKDAIKAKQLLKFLRSRGYSEKSFGVSESHDSGAEGEEEKGLQVSSTKDRDKSAPAEGAANQGLRQPVVLRGFPADQNVLKCVEDLRHEYLARYGSKITPGSRTSENDLPPWKRTYKLYCDFQVEWPSQSSSSSNIPGLAASPAVALDSLDTLDARPPPRIISHGIVTLADINGNGAKETAHWLQKMISPQTDGGKQGGVVPGSVACALRLLCYLFQSRSNTASLDEALWMSPRLYNKLETQMQDVLSMCSGIYPPWCDVLVTNCKFFFPREIREKLFRATSFGCTRSLHWFRQQLNIEENGTASGGDSLSSSIPSGGGMYNQEISISPIPKERVKVHRDNILQSAEAVMKMHAKRKAILDVVFVGEKGYGSGVTAAFYSSTAHALQSVIENQQQQYWIPGENDETELEQSATQQVSGVEGADGSANTVIRHSNGLFPFPHRLPSTKLVERFRTIGRLAGKALMDGRLLPLPLSPQFMKLVIGESFGLEELEKIFLSHGRILFSMYKASNKLVAGDKDVMIDQMEVSDWLDAVGFTFIDPLSQRPLVDNGDNISVTVANLSKYVRAVLELWLDSGIRAQVLAFREGFGEVLPLAKLRLLFVPELLALLCGEEDIRWDVASLVKNTKLAHGYTKDSLPVQYFMEVLEEMSGPERRAFLLYATGCPNLPPRGFQALKPPFEVVRRVVDNLDVDRALPFARTCTNTLHLPAYSSKAVLANQLFFAIANSGGVIDRD